jgi:glycosyltransferase 2 family protein
MSSAGKRNVLIAAGMVVSLVFLYLAFRDISWSELVDGVGKMNPWYFIPCILLNLAIQLLRAVRFGIILRPFCPLSTKQLWDLLNIWAAASMIMPARLGELVRPYLLQRRGTSFSSVLGAVMVERFFDLSGLLLLLGLVLWSTPEVPRVYSLVGEIVLACLVIGYIIVLLILNRRERFGELLKKLLSWLPEGPAHFIEGMFLRLIDGFGIMASFSQAAIMFLCSVALWGLFSCLTYLFLLAFSIEAPFLVAVTIQVFLCLGVALPSAPGFIGTFHAAGRYALTLFGIKSVVAVSFATVYHLFSLVICLVLGLVSYWTSDFRLDRDLLSDEDEEPDPHPTGVSCDCANVGPLAPEPIEVGPYKESTKNIA